MFDQVKNSIVNFKDYSVIIQ